MFDDACPVYPKGTMVIPMLWRISGYVVCMMGVKHKNHHTHPLLTDACADAVSGSSYIEEVCVFRVGGPGERSEVRSDGITVCERVHVGIDDSPVS